MHQYKAVAQILLLLSIFNLVLGAPVVREIYEARDDGAVPVVARNVAVMSKERSQVDSDMLTPSHSSPPPQDESTTSYFPAPMSDGSTPLYASSPSDGDASLHKPDTSRVSLFGRFVAARRDCTGDGSTACAHGTIPQGNTAAMRTHVPLAEDPATMAEMVETLSKKAAMLQNIYMDTSEVTFWTETFHFEFPNPLRASGE